MSAISPCAHPSCRDVDGNRRLTTQTMCDPCRIRFRRELGWIVMDYVTFKATMPSPVHGGGQARHVVRQSFGHPAQDASDACREIAWQLSALETKLRAHLGEGAAPVLETTAEQLLVGHAYAYLSGHFEALCDWADVGAEAGAIHDTHQTNRAKYGLNRLVEPRLPMPCPTCDVAMLVRGASQIVCENCGRLIREEEYPMLTRIALDWAIDDYQEEVASAAAAAEGVQTVRDVIRPVLAFVVRNH